jgi:hypothetical protein
MRAPLEQDECLKVFTAAVQEIPSGNPRNGMDCVKPDDRRCAVVG